MTAAVYEEDLFGGFEPDPVVETPAHIPHIIFTIGRGKRRTGFELGTARPGGWCFVQDAADGRVWIVKLVDDRWKAIVDPATVRARSALIQQIIATGLLVAPSSRYVHLRSCPGPAETTKRAGRLVQRQVVDAIMYGGVDAKLPERHLACPDCIVLENPRTY